MQKHLPTLLFALAILLSGKIFAQGPPVFPTLAANPALPVFNANDVSYLDQDTAVAVGNNGMTWRSTDGGLNWNIIPTFTSTANNNSVIMMKSYICIAGDNGTVTFSNDRGLSWQNATPAQPLINYRGVHFADSTFGASVGDNGNALIYHWVGGLGWANISTTQIDTLNAVACYKTSTSVFVDGFAIAVGNNGAVSTYASGSWTNLTPPTTMNLNGVYLFPNNTDVLAVGQDGLILKSTNYGTNWTTVNNTGYTLRDISEGLVPGQFIAVGDSGAVYISNDNGNSFVEYTLGFTNTDLKGVSTKDPKGAFAGSGNTLRVYEADTITVTYVSDSVLCPGGSFKAAIDLKGLYGTANTVSLQLSNSSGSFSLPVTIGSKLNPLPTDTITGTIPASATASVLYRVRVVSSDPVVTSLPYTSTFTVLPAPNNQSIAVYNGTDLFVNSQSGCTYQWYYNAAIMGGMVDTIVTTIGNGNYYVVITGANSCTYTTTVFNYNSTGIKLVTQGKITLSPNPASEVVHLTVPESMIGRTVTVYNALGAKMYAEKIRSQTSGIQTAAWEPGLYFVMIDTKISKLVITR